MIPTKNNSQISIGVAVVFKEYKGEKAWLVVKQGDEDRWELPKVTVRKGESSVRSVIRLTSEMAGMKTRVLEEVGRVSGTVTLNGRQMAQKHYYYLMIYKAGGADPVGFVDHTWLEYSKATKKLPLKREQEMLKDAKVLLKEWEKTHSKKQIYDVFDEEDRELAEAAAATEAV